jgi:hypothetical protein
VVADPTDPTRIDWEATLHVRHHLWSYGFGVAEAMDTAQRGMGLTWPMAAELIKRTAVEARSVGASAVYGVATDQLPFHEVSLEEIKAAYLEQLEVVEASGGQAILMASRAMAVAARTADDYLSLYGAVISQASRPVMLHWLGEVFDPALAGYWATSDPWEAVTTIVLLAEVNAGRIDGIKISLLDHELELELRRRLPPGVRVFTGDDFNYVSLILGDEQGHSDALLGVFDPIAPVASQALLALDRGDVDGYLRWLEPTVPFARHLFSAPTYHYKTGITFLAYLNGYQDHWRMLAGAETARSLSHLGRLFILADEAGLLTDPDRAQARMEAVARTTQWEPASTT